MNRGPAVVSRRQLPTNDVLAASKRLELERLTFCFVGAFSKQLDAVCVVSILRPLERQFGV